MSETVKLKKEDLVKAFYNSTPEIQKVLQGLYPKENLSTNILDRIKNLDDLLEFSGELRDDIIAFPNPKNGNQKAVNSTSVLYLLTEVLNKSTGKIIDWNNSSQRKHYPWFYMNNGSAGGSGFRLYFLFSDFDSSCVGGRLVFLDENHLNHALKYFFDDYKNIFVKED